LTLPFGGEDEKNGTFRGAFQEETSSEMQNTCKLVGGLEHFLSFHMLGIIIPIDFHIF